MGETADPPAPDRRELELERRREAPVAETPAARHEEGAAGRAPTASDRSTEIYRIERSAIRLRRHRIVSGRQAPEASLVPYTRTDRQPAGGVEQDDAAPSRLWGWLKAILFGSRRPPSSGGSEAPCPEPADPAAGQDLVGIALSGGGIRSASFNLGLLQGLASRNALWVFDYLSTVSGGGFVGAWWSAWLSRKQERADIFPAAEELEPIRRSRTAILRKGDERPTEEEDEPDGSLIASERGDPIHFLRLFSNYLTPRTGAFSPDTWRLIAFFTRNLLFTWLVLLPLLLAAMMAAQAFFVSNEDVARAFLCGPAGAGSAGSPVESATATATAKGTSTAPAVAFALAVAPAPTLQSIPAAPAASASSVSLCGEFRSTRAASLRARASHLALPFLILGTAYATLALLWLVHASANVALTVGSLGLVGTLALRLVPSSGGAGPAHGKWSILGVAVGCLVFHVVQSIKGYRRSSSGGGFVTASAADHRGWLSKQQTWILRVSLCFGGLLLAAGFGPDLAVWLFGGDDSVSGRFLAKSGGWGGVLLALASAVYTGIKAAPSTDGTVPPPPGRFGRLVFAIAPPLVLALLVIGAAWLGHALLRFSIDRPVTREALESGERLLALATVVVVIAALELVYAAFESFHDPALPPKAGAFWTRLLPDAFQGLLGRSQGPGAGPKMPWFYLFSPRGWARVAALTGLGVVAMLLPGRSLANLRGTFAVTNLAALVVILLVGALTYARRDWRIALGSARPAVLLVFASASAALCLVSGMHGGNRDALLIALLWVALLVGGVVAAGWLVDPNLLSLHGFYKGRLSRAYLGASNTARNNEEITDSAPGDDIPLTEVWNHDVGAPYHLINTTLSLVGGSDLATSQRSAENFVLSRYHCGSARAGYRCTAHYMGGEMSLATAAAISGAAISPNMGSQTPSAALGLLLSLMNLRLGFWAPTPSGRRWSEPQARLWPFYVLRETISNTGQIGTYCYLTDGGHFDNTGLYALVERGCRFIVVSDCGADPKPGFDDIGTAIRRCRIDFGAEIDLRIDGFTARKEDRTAPAHVVWGTIRYQPGHLRMLGLDETATGGVILWVKPSVTALNAADVRQYHRANVDFPQQSTGDQWYDESQFESYRRLGYESARAAFAEPAPVAGAFDQVVSWFQAPRPAGT